MMLLCSPILPCATIEPRTSTQTRSAISDVMSAWSYGGLTCARARAGRDACSVRARVWTAAGGGLLAGGGRVLRAHLDDLHPAEALGGDEADHLQGLARQEAAGLGPPRPRDEARLRGGGRCGVRLRGRGWEARFSRALLARAPNSRRSRAPRCSRCRSSCTRRPSRPTRGRAPSRSPMDGQDGKCGA